MATKSTTKTTEEPKIEAPAPISAPKSGGSYVLAEAMCLNKQVLEPGTPVTPDQFSEENWKRHLAAKRIVEA